MQFDLLLTPSYWQTVIAAVMSILTMCAVPALGFIAAFAYGKKASWLSLAGLAYLVMSIISPPQPIEMFKQKGSLELEALLRVGSLCIFLFGLLYFEAYHKKGKGRVIESILDIFMSAERAKAFKWVAMEALGYVFMSLGVISGSYATVIYYNWNLLHRVDAMGNWLPWLLLFLGLFNVGLFFTIRSRNKEENRA